MQIRTAYDPVTFQLSSTQINVDTVEWTEKSLFSLAKFVVQVAEKRYNPSSLEVISTAGKRIEAFNLDD